MQQSKNLPIWTAADFPSTTHTHTDTHIHTRPSSHCCLHTAEADKLNIFYGAANTNNSQAISPCLNGFCLTINYILEHPWDLINVTRNIEETQQHSCLRGLKGYLCAFYFNTHYLYIIYATQSFLMLHIYCVAKCVRTYSLCGPNMYMYSHTNFGFPHEVVTFPPWARIKGTTILFCINKPTVMHVSTYL